MKENYSQTKAVAFKEYNKANGKKRWRKRDFKHFIFNPQLCVLFIITEEQLKLAKTQLKVAVLMEGEDSNVVGNCLATQALHSGEVITSDAVLKSIDAVSVNNVNSVLKRVVSGKPAMAAAGDLSNTPNLDQLL